MGIVEIKLQQPLQLQADVGIKHRHHRFHPAIQIAGHPVGTAEEQLGFAVVGKPEEA